MYLLERDEDGGGDVVIEDLPRQEALGALLVHTPPVGFLVNIGYDAHWRFLGQLVQQVPVRVLRYPSGFDRLGEIHTALERAHAQQREEAAFLASR